MSFYQSRVLPYLVHMSMRQEGLSPYRRRVAAAAEGCILEIGVGSGINLPYYSERAVQVVGLDPSTKLLSMAREAMRKSELRVELLHGSAETIPLPDNSVDTVVTTWTLCSISDVVRALSEMRRVLKPEGRLLFVEHGLSPDAKVRFWQNRLTPLWKRIGGGCHLNRPIGEMVQGAGFHIERMDTGYMDGPKPMTYMYEGIARP